MKTAWTKGVEPQEKEEVQASFRSSALIRRRLASILESKVAERERSDMSADGYEVANWAYKMADSQGYKRAMAEILSLISEK